MAFPGFVFLKLTEAREFRIGVGPSFLKTSGRTVDIRILRTSVTENSLPDMARQQFGDMVKAVVDVEQEIMAIGGELHSDEEAMLLEQGSLQGNLWGINLYPDKSLKEWIEFDSMINVRPSGGNRSRSVERPEIRDVVTRIVHELVEE